MCWGKKKWGPSVSLPGKIYPGRELWEMGRQKGFAAEKMREKKTKELGKVRKFIEKKEHLRRGD